MIHLLKNVIVTFFGALLLFMFKSMPIIFIGILMIIYGTFSAVLNMTVDKHIKL